jgi:hypothetical protein
MTTTTTSNQRRIRSPSLAKYIKNVQQANERTAEQYEYRLSKFEKYLVTVYEEQEQQQQHQNLEQTTVLDHIINELKIANNNKINDRYLLMLTRRDSRSHSLNIHFQEDIM